MFHIILRKFGAFKSDTSGIVLVLVAFLIVPFMILLGMAVDVGRLLVVKNRLISAVDAAAIDLAKNPSLTNATGETNLVNAFVNADFPSRSGITFSQPTIVRSNNNMNVDVTVAATINTAFAQVVGVDTLTTTVHSQAVVAQNHIEVVLVLDNTGSMNSMYGSTTGIAGLQTAATTLVNTLFANDPTQQYVKIGVVPFTDTVNVGAQYATAAWIDNSNAAGSMSQENIAVPTGTGLITFASNLAAAAKQSSWAWGGCVRQRTEPYDVEDVAPSAGIPATLYTPFFAPDEPDCCTTLNQSNTSFYNSYLSDGSSTTLCRKGLTYPYSKTTDEANVQKCVSKYTTPSAQGNGAGPNSLCTPLQPIIRLTNDQSAILTEINAMVANGATVIPAGLMWGWHLLSPNGPFADGVPYSDQTTIKAIILVTDGFNDVQLSSGNGVPTSTSNGFDKSIYNAYGYGTGPHLNLVAVPNGVNEDQPDYNLDLKLTALCNNIKAVTDANGNPGRIVIYAIGFGTAINSHGLSLMQQCASSASTYFYNPTGAQLNATFQNIAIGLNNLRLSR